MTTNRLKTILWAAGMSIGSCTFAQTWEAPAVPGADISTVGTSTVGYLYNVETDAFLINGMTWNTNACATRLTNGDQVVSEPQQCVVNATSSNHRVRISLKAYSNYTLSCLSAAANNIYVDQNEGNYFTYTETETGSHVYTLTNVAYSKPLDVTWDGGGHLTIAGGAGHTLWAFIPETNVTNGAYALYKQRRLLYRLYQAIDASGTAGKYATELQTALSAYLANDATTTTIARAARTLFEATATDISEPTDVSFLFTDADMSGTGSAQAWTSTSTTFGWSEFEKYHATITLKQTQTVPQGLYDVCFRSLYRQDGSNAAPTLTATGANSMTSDLPLMGNLDYSVTNTNNNGWSAGNQYNQPNNMQSAAQGLTHDQAVATVADVIVGSDHKLTIEVKVSSTSQWVNWQGFKIVYKGAGTASLVADLRATIAEATTLMGTDTSSAATTLKAVIDQAQATADDPSADMTTLIAANQTLKDAIEAYRLASASVDNPLDYTDLIDNPSFEKGFDGWTQQQMATQSNTAFTLKSGTTYVEKWVSKGNRAGDAKVSQTISAVPMGVYILRVSAQNIQESSNATQSGAWIFADMDRQTVTTRNTYDLIFTHIEKNLNIGFEAQNASGNWIAADNFRLLYAGGTTADFDAAMQKYIDKAETLTDAKMQKAVAETLKTAISSAKTALEQSDTDSYPDLAATLHQAIDAAEESANAIAALEAAIALAEDTYSASKPNGVSELTAAIDAAKEMSNNLTSSPDEIAKEIEKLEQAKFAYMIANGSGTAPTVVTDSRFARGNNIAFGRMTVSGISTSQILEQGFCWSTDKEPTVLDNRSTAYISNNGNIYKMPGMKPATIYYARAYAITKNYAVGYGDVIKIVTIPKANITWWYNNGGPTDANERINNAFKVAIDGYWNSLTSINDYHISCSYGAGTPTADCSYGGSMRIGPNASYQAPGTVMHESNHGIGVGTTPLWYGPSCMRANSSSGLWLGDRVTALLSFWENTYTTLTGDNTHMWPYGINGAQEDNGSESLYTCNGLLNQALCEDGLIPVGYWSGGFCLPAYVLNQEDDVKYYLKNEDTGRGLATSYLTEGTNGQLTWTAMGSDEALADDHAAWYISFTPSNQYYQLRNAATGHYITYSGSAFKAAAKSRLTANEDFHVMRGRVDVEVGDGNTAFLSRGYWFIHPEGSSTPATLTANTSNKVGSTAFSLDNSATTQRWLVLTADEVKAFESSTWNLFLDDLNKMIANVKGMQEVPHHEDVDDADATLSSAISNIEAQRDAATSAAQLNTLTDETRTAGMTYLAGVTPERLEEPFDITFLMTNAAITSNNGWSDAPTFNYNCCEYFEKTFDFNQTITNIPKGTYMVSVQAFQRPGSYTDVYSKWQNNNTTTNAYLYAGSKSVRVANIMLDAQSKSLYSDNVAVGQQYIPNSMHGASCAFDAGLYQNNITTTSQLANGSLKIGLRCTTSDSGYWTCFRNFHLYYYGKLSADTVTGIDNTGTTDTAETRPQDVTRAYNLQGQQIGNSTQNLPNGIYIIGGKKTVIR